MCFTISIHFIYLRAFLHRYYEAEGSEEQFHQIEHTQNARVYEKEMQICMFWDDKSSEMSKSRALFFVLLLNADERGMCNDLFVLMQLMLRMLGDR